ncbi:MAG: Cof-type HAD-IIB family hydrolase [Lysinibacillus sp.]
MTKILFFDVDGTLYNSEKKLPMATIEAIERARNNGHEIAIATGRAPFMIRSLLEELKLDTYVCFNGQYVVYKGDVIFTDGVPKEELKRIVAFGEERQEPVVYLDAHEMVASTPGHKGIAESLATLKYPYPRIDRTFYETNAVYQTLIYVKEEQEQFYNETFPNIQLVRWHPYSCDLLPKEGSKARGIQKLLDHIGRPIEDAIAFGDGLNDVEMIEAVGLGVVMGNGHEKALAVADVVAPHVDEDGLAKVMVELELI